MSTAVATTEPTKVMTAFVNPLDLPAEIAKVDHAVNDYINSVVGQAEDEIKYMQRRREVAASVRRIHAVREEMTEVVQMAELTGPVLAGQQLDGLKADMVRQFKVVNPAGTDEQITAAVDSLVSGFKGQLTEAPKPGRGKRSAG